MKKISAPVLDAESERGSLNKGLRITEPKRFSLRTKPRKVIFPHRNSLNAALSM